MARIRCIKPEFWTSEQVGACSLGARLLFIGMWNFCDDNGIHQASPIRLKAEVFPMDDCTKDQVSSWVSELASAGLLNEYQVGGTPYWQVTGWKHQKIDKPTYKFPHPNGAIPVSPDRPEPKSPLRNNSRDRRELMALVCERDGSTCAYCGADDRSALELDHIIAVERGGGDDMGNLCAACSSCNRSKGVLSVLEFAARRNLSIVDMSPIIRRHVDETSPPEGKGREGSGKEGMSEAVSFVFEGSVIRLTKKDFETWHSSFSAIPDLRAELTSIDAWLMERGRTKDWFGAAAGMLSNKQQKIISAKSSKLPINQHILRV